MIKTSLGVVGVIVALALVVPASLNVYAATNNNRPPVGGGGVPSLPGGGLPSNPGFSTPSGPLNGGSGGNGGDLPTPTSDEQIKQLEDTCNGALATLVKIPERMVVAFADQNAVNVIPVCNSGLGKAAVIDASQAFPLQDAISNNAALLAALGAKGFKPDDVVGVVLLDGAATLYVHHKA